MNHTSKNSVLSTSDRGVQEKISCNSLDNTVDAYFSADVETDGPIPGPYSMLSFAIVYAGSFDGKRFLRPQNYNNSIYIEIKPISHEYQNEALKINGIDRKKLVEEGEDPIPAMSRASTWVKNISNGASPVLVAYPLSFDWSWLYWYFTRFSSSGSPFGHSRCYDIKTAYSIKSALPISDAGRSRIPQFLQSKRAHTHNALDDAIEQAEIFANVFEWKA